VKALRSSTIRLQLLSALTANSVGQLLLLKAAWPLPVAAAVVGVPAARLLLPAPHRRARRGGSCCCGGTDSSA
jgi:hypothetical protein